MDRKAILREKRKRLEELREKRLEHHSELLDVISLKEEQIKHNVDVSSRSVSVGVQAGIEIESKLEVQTDTQIITKHELELYKFDKGVQTYEEELVEEQLNNHKDKRSRSISEQDQEQKVKPATDMSAGINGEIDEANLNSELSDSFKFLNKIVAQEKLNSSILTNITSELREVGMNNDQHISKERSENIFSLSCEISAIDSRGISCVEFSPHIPTLAAAAYFAPSNSKSNYKSKVSKSNISYQSPGLAVIYNTKENVSFPEFILNALSPISAICFDRTNPLQVIGGLRNGKVVIWKLDEKHNRGIAILPTLESPLWLDSTLSVSSRSNSKSFSHKEKIISLHQVSIDNNDCIISMSGDGILNIWSSNMLARPKYDSILLRNPSHSTSIDRSIRYQTSILLPEQDLRTISQIKDFTANRKPEFKFIDRMIVGCDDGSLFKLKNDEEAGFFDFELKNNRDSTILETPIVSMDFIEHEDISCLLMHTCLNWHIELSDPYSDTHSFSRQITTNYMTSVLACRKKNKAQFVSVGNFDQSTENIAVPKLEFWDLSKNASHPLFSYKISEFPRIKTRMACYASSLTFNEDGDRIAIALSNGHILVLFINEEELTHFLT